VLEDSVSPDVDGRVAVVVDGAELAPIAAGLRAGRERILDRWLATARRQPFHAERPDSAVTDHVPRLFDAIVALLEAGSGINVGEAPAPLEDPALEAAATGHAQMRFEQGLGPVAVVTEFRLLRHEIARALRELLHEDADPGDVVAGLAVIGDALDGAATVALTSLSSRIETLRESFLATTLHDIRQPITLVEGSLLLVDRWLSGPSADDERVREGVQDALIATNELVAMVETMSDASRVAMGALEPDPEPCRLDAVVRGAVEALGSAGRERIRLVQTDGTHLIGLWDEHLLHRLVINLLSNAIKYSPPDGEVTVELGRDGPDRALLVVTDRGLGMTEAELDTVFERFVRADRARRRNIPGLGLGLYACRGIVAAHGGTIRLSSPGHDRGTRVDVHLPLMAVEPED
jgi:signal transduction histidine kinase